MACVANGQKALNKIKELRPDVVFLDIKMPGMNGFDVAREILISEPSPLIVFATAYDEYAIKAFDVKAIDYILKPFSKKRLGETVKRLKETKTKAITRSDLGEIIDKLKDNLSKREFVRVSVLENGRIVLLSPRAIFFCRAHEGKSRVYVTDKSFLCPVTLNELEEHLKAQNFLRVHRGYLVNLSRIKNIVPWFNGKYLITMQDSQSTEITVSRNNVRTLKKVLAL